VIFLLLFLIISLGLGKKIWSRLFDQPGTPLDIIEEGIFCVSIGLGILSIIILVIGLLGILHFWTVLSIFILLFIVLFTEIKGYLQAIYHIKESIFYSFCHDHLFFILSPFFMVALIWFFLASRVPPVFYDALIYHLGIPNQYLINHTIRFLPNAFHSHHPFLIQNLFSICLLLGRHSTPKLLVLMFAIFNGVSLSLFAARFFNRPISWLAGGIFVLTPSILITGSLVNVDLGFSLYTLLTLYALCMWARKKEKKWLILSAIMTGFSLGTKYTAIIFCLGLCLLCLFFLLIKERQSLRYSVKVIIIYVFIALSVGSGWYIKNLVWTKNPFYPKWADVWGNPKIPEENLAVFNASAHAYDAKDNTRNSIFSLPLDLVLHPEWFGVGGTIGPLLFILLPLAFIPDKKNKVYSMLILYCITYYFAWAFTFRMTRFALPLFAILILLATNTLIRLFQSKKNLFSYIIVIVFVLGFSYNIYYSISTFSRVYNPWKYLTGKETEESYLSRVILSYPIFRYINDNLPSNSRILFLGETVNFYCLRDVISSTAFDINPIVPVFKNAKTKEDVYAYLKLMGVTHLLINFPEMDRLEHSYKTFELNEKDLKLLKDIVRSSTILARRILLRGGQIILIKV
jgi:4-amino-4-deoxy-L-arabinose transferase-like glycosyltransferase